MVWKAGSETLQHWHQSSPAETQVRKIASRIGLDDSEILSTIFHKMRQEYVVAEWQLPVLDSRQWEQLHAPIGLAVAVQHISANQSLPLAGRVQRDVRVENDRKKDEEKQLQQQQEKEERMLVLEENEGKLPPVATVLNMITKQEEKKEIETIITTPTKYQILEERNRIDGTEKIKFLIVEKEEQGKKILASTVPEEFDGDCVDMMQYDDSGNDCKKFFKTEQEIIIEEEKKQEITSLSGNNSSDVGRNNSTIQLTVMSNDFKSSEDSIIAGISSSASSSTDEDVFEEETHMYLLDPLTDDDVSTLDTLLWLHDDDITVVVSNVSPDCKKTVSRTKESKQYKHAFKKKTSTYVVETAALQEILLNLPDNDHRAILSQLMIMANAREEVSRMNIALQVKDSLLNIIEKNEIEVDSEQTIKLIMHLARLKKPYRSLFGRSLFKAMSRLFKRTEKLKGKCKKEKREFLLDQERSQQSKQIIDRQGNNGDTGISV